MYTNIKNYKHRNMFLLVDWLIIVVKNCFTHTHVDEHVVLGIGYIVHVDISMNLSSYTARIHNIIDIILI